jgi:hypothetical protein
MLRKNISINFANIQANKILKTLLYNSHYLVLIMQISILNLTEYALLCDTKITVVKIVTKVQCRRNLKDLKLYN